MWTQLTRGNWKIHFFHLWTDFVPVRPRQPIRLQSFIQCCVFFDLLNTFVFFRLNEYSASWEAPLWAWIISIPGPINFWQPLLTIRFSHVNCLAHNLNRVAEKVMETFPELNSVISLGRQVFMEAPLRRQLLLEAGLTPPEPIITRWGTWIQATKCYLENYEAFSAFIDNLDTKSTAIANLKAVHSTSADIIQQQLMEVNLKYYSFVMAFEALESRSCTAQKAKLVLD